MVEENDISIKKEETPARRFKQQGLMRLLFLVLGLFALNFAGDLWYKRFDLTKEKRYTLSNATSDLCGKLDDVVYVQIFLDGDFPSEYRLLKNATRDMLDEFRHASNGMLEYRFEDVLTDRTIEEKEDILQQLSSKGLQITKAELDEDEAETEKYIIPAGLVMFKNNEYPLNLLKRDFGKPLTDEINGSIELLEYEIGNIIRKCVAQKEVNIAFTEGHGELENMFVADFAKSLKEYYKVDRLNINLADTNCTKFLLSAIEKNPENGANIIIEGVMKRMKQYKALILAKPRMAFSDAELFLLDQYVMQGGKLIVLQESLIAEMDSVGKYGSLMTADHKVNLNDLWFRYGARINLDLIQDLNSHGVPVLAADGSGKPDFKPWIFYPLYAPDGEHPIVRNLTTVWGRFASSIDTLPNKDVIKTVLLHSGANSRVANNPVSISLKLIGMKMNPAMFNKPNNIGAVLLEGKFTSVFAHRPAIKERSPFPVTASVPKNAMILISDGDLIANQINTQDKQIYPLGYDRYASKAFNEPIVFANKKFLLNCVDYLCDDSNLIEVRSKKIVLRLLDKVKVKTERTKWQAINMVLPVVLMILFGFINAFWRRRKYTQ